MINVVQDCQRYAIGIMVIQEIRWKGKGVINKNNYTVKTIIQYTSLVMKKVGIVKLDL